MVKIQYEIIKATPIPSKVSPRDLISISRDRQIVASSEPFGPATFKKNIKEMRKFYFHPKTGEIIRFKKSTTAESILIASCDFLTRTKFRIFDNFWLQAGLIVRGIEGFFANPPKDANRNYIINEKILRSYLDGTTPIKVDNGKVYIIPNTEYLKDFGYAEYKTFRQGKQDGKDFAESGLARVLEHTEGEARCLGEIFQEVYKLGVNVWGFDNVNEPVLGVANLDSYRFGSNSILGVGGLNWANFGGYAFGILDTGSEGTSQNS